LDGLTPPLLSVENLIVALKTSQGTVLGVNDFSFSVGEQETVCITGESGAGKTLTTLAILGLLPENTLYCKGMIHYQGRDLLHLPDTEKQRLRGNEIGVVFQEPACALNPVMKIRDQIKEIFLLDDTYNKSEALTASLELLDQMGIRNAKEVGRMYPHQLSVGMQQRVLIAMAICRKPKLLIADEPTTALDATTQIQMIELIQRLQMQIGLSVIWITHDLSLAARVADRTIIMYAGKTMESASTQQILQEAHHPYTLGLLQSMPIIAIQNGTMLKPIKGIYQPKEQSHECVFYPRCNTGKPYCRQSQPPLKEVSNRHFCACWNSYTGI
jgi:oligopeptide/dipeptide ABC transporter ATP-binding protein